MEIRTRRVDLGKTLSEIWERYVADLRASCEVMANADEATYEDARASKRSIEALEFAGIISDEECEEIKERIDAIRKQYLDLVNNRVTRNKED